MGQRDKLSIGAEGLQNYVLDLFLQAGGDKSAQYMMTVGEMVVVIGTVNIPNTDERAFAVKGPGGENYARLLDTFAAHMVNRLQVGEFTTVYEELLEI